MREWLSNAVPPKGTFVAVQAPKAAGDIVVDVWAILAKYLPPDSGITPEDCISELLELIDRPEVIAILQRHGRIPR